MKKLLLLLVLISAAAFYFFQKKGGWQEPEFVRFENIKFKNITLPPDLKLTFETNAILSNPNFFAVDISQVEFDVFVDGEKTTHVKQALEIQMPAESEFAMPLSFDVPFGKKGIFGKFKDMLSGAWKKQGVKIRSAGTITVRASRFQYDIPFDYDDEYRIEDYL